MMITVNVTQEDIDAGWAGGANSCPIARALSGIIRKPFDVGERAIYNNEIGANPTIANLPEEAKVFSSTQFTITRLAHGRGLVPIMLRPFSFSIDIPPQYLRPEIVKSEVAKLAGEMTEKYMASHAPRSRQLEFAGR